MGASRQQRGYRAAPARVLRSAACATVLALVVCGLAMPAWAARSSGETSAVAESGAAASSTVVSGAQSASADASSIQVAEPVAPGSSPGASSAAGEPSLPEAIDPATMLGSSSGASSETSSGLAEEAPEPTLGEEVQQLLGNENLVNPRQTPDSSFLFDTSIRELVAADASFQGNTVQVTGEVIGDALMAEEDPGMHWIMLESTEPGVDSAISVLVSDSALPLIDTFGGYNTRGTVLQVRGTFYLTCPSHEGILDIHADTVTLVERGYATPEEFGIAPFVPGIVLVVIGLALTLLYNHLREREL